MTRKTSWETYAYLSILLFAFFILFSGCSKSSDKTQKKQTKQTIEKQSEQTVEAETKHTETRSVNPGDDIGTPCKNHEYIMSSGSSANLDFSVKLKCSFYDLKMYRNKNIDESDVELIKSLDYWDDLGAESELLYMNLESVRNSTNMWGVDASRLLDEYDDGELINIQGQTASKIDYRIIFTEDGKAIFDRLGEVWSAEKIAGLSIEEIDKILGDEKYIKYTSKSGETYDLPIEQINVDKKEYFLNMNFRVSMPASEQKNVGCERYYQANTKNGEVAKFVIKFTFDKNIDGLFHIFGPDNRSECE